MSTTQAEELVRLLPRVVACRIRADDQGHPVAIMVTAVPGSNAQEVRADVITVLGAQARLDVLEEQIHVAVLEEPAEELVVEEIEAEARLRLLSHSTRVGEERSQAEVELAHGSRVARGRAKSRGPGEAPELLASACLDAAENLCHGRVVFRLVGFRLTTVGAEDVVCVLVQETRGRDERHLVGTARVSTDVSRAAAYAALDAVNRRLGRILADPPTDYEIT
ncbi:MAG: hypothetical protein JSW67_09175 [Candidatus Latescibacterota bacterium]|nr:MAG: hypothetical protein JSW67_09175 [Candidatus Latescibacterota bacterium]